MLLSSEKRNRSRGGGLERDEKQRAGLSQRGCSSLSMNRKLVRPRKGARGSLPSGFFPGVMAGGSPYPQVCSQESWLGGGSLPSGLFPAVMAGGVPEAAVWKPPLPVTPGLSPNPRTPENVSVACCPEGLGLLV